MPSRTAVVRKNIDGNFLILFPEEEAYGDTCRAFVPTQVLLPIMGLSSHKMDYISRGAYLQTTSPVKQDDADRIMRLYSEDHCAQQETFRIVDHWAR